ncbi:SPX domain-containing protein 2 [Seminavis robusta]|uniref:SPX domain-containing protein 2 n=1 Tax=Seminavis robusta TaxID=568900 RepID=A0A9N8E4W9_9STRA|nr:SPX domain-containing protein 2 [Seminavis robusta]|eukprot:Sro672_g184990.1 SPX domain-containing protein 2 (431) ;mRNA; f:5169-6692
MKFCKNLQRVVEISDPEWAPYWINYKQLKKLIKGIVSSSSTAITADPATSSNTQSNPSSSNNNDDATTESITQNQDSPGESFQSAVVSAVAVVVEGQQQQQAAADHQSNGDETSERRQADPPPPSPEPTDSHNNNDVTAVLGRSPGEIAFFKLLHTEVKKASHFFEQAQKEYQIREERVRKGMELVKNERAAGDTTEEQWSRVAQSIFRLYRELLLLETFAIMTYCGFSKILKKHDKNTGFSTRDAFMAKVVNQANFTNYPLVLQMINRCEQLYEEASNRLAQEGKESLHEDERLFIHMIHRLNAQVVGVDDARKPAADAKLPAKDPTAKEVTLSPQAFRQLSYTPFVKAAWKAQSLKELVAENDASLDPNNKQREDDSDSDGDGNSKPKAATTTTTTTTTAAKKKKTDQDRKRKPSRKTDPDSKRRKDG